ncbi:MAG: hypothetical protein ACRD1G_02675 [Acidimicrobiales bacterium]
MGVALGLGMFLPVIWVAVNAVTIENATKRLGLRAFHHYGLDTSVLAVPTYDEGHRRWLRGLCLLLLRSTCCHRRSQ